MKKSFLSLLPILGIVAMTATSCSDNCCTFSVLKECEGDEPAGQTWEEHKADLEAAGWNC